MYKVFIQNKALNFIKQKSVKKFNGIFISSDMALSKPESVLQLLSQNDDQAIFIFSRNRLETMQAFFKAYQWVEAAGGIVVKKDSYLFIKRNGFWDLPKGKIDAGEKPKQAAVREIEEECGIRANRIDKLITTTYHVYEFEQKKFIKKTYWYKLSFSGNKKLVPQLEEGITKVEWLKEKDLKKVYKNTFPSIVTVLDCFFKNGH